MKGFTNMTVATKLIGGFLIVAGIAAIIGLIGLRSTAQVNELAELMYNRDTIGLRDTAHANEQLLLTARAIRVAALAPTNDVRAEQIQAVAQHLRTMDEALSQSAANYVTSDGKALLSATRDAARAYAAAIGEVVQELDTEPLQQTRNSVALLYGKVKPLADKVDQSMARLIAYKLEDAQALSQQTLSIYEQARMLMIGLILGGILLGIGIGVLLTRSLTRQLGGEPAQVALIASAIAQGDLSTLIDTSRAPRNSVMSAMARMQDALRQIVLAVRTSSDNIAVGSNQITIGNADLAQRTERQAADITETAAAMDEMSSTVLSNAESTQKAASLADQASSAATLGGESIDRIISTMNDIRASSKQIVGIIEVIDSIAFQTNILALNAAVEAARAGDQGRGFAVVASEVRNLAQKSAAAGREITALIDASARQTDEGGRVIHEAGERVRGLVGQIQQVAHLIDDVNVATTEQTTGLGQINAAVTQLSDITQQNAALVEESATAAGSLNEQARQLVEIVREFTLERDIGRAAADTNQPPSDGRPAHHPRINGGLLTMSN